MKNTDYEKIKSLFKSYKNKYKKEYGLAYLIWLNNNEQGIEPDTTNLSYMGKQAVRMDIAKIIKGDSNETL